MRRNWLAGAAVAAVAISVPVTALTAPVLGGTAQAATLSSQQKATVATTVKPRQIKKAVVTPLWNKVAAALAKKLVGAPYEFGGTSPAGFDCSGFTQYVYEHTGGGKRIDRTAEDQFLEFKRISKGDARPGDLVFFHDSSNPDSYVYHVGVFEGGNDMAAAATYGVGVVLQSFTWAGDTVTFGTITHS
jgi:cell wall-associated NlpC family hydrolase